MAAMGPLRYAKTAESCGWFAGLKISCILKAGCPSAIKAYGSAVVAAMCMANTVA